MALSSVVLLLGLICSAVGMVSYVAAQGPASPILWTTTLTPLPAGGTEENQREYYRGMFDICVASGRNGLAPKEQILENCRNLVRLAIEQEWFETPSNEWLWPLPEEWSNNFEQMSAY
jgi:hypothetical protein